MNINTSAKMIKQFFENAASLTTRCLILDYDGTLAPFQVNRDHAIPYPGIREMLTALLATNTRVAIVSGRSVADLKRLLAIDPLPELWGCHGWEHMLPNGEPLPIALSETMQDGLSHAWKRIQDAELVDHAEHKPVGIAVHWRGYNEQTVARIRTTATTLWSDLLDLYSFQLHAFDGGVELRASGRNKATAVETMLHELPKPAAIAYLGDDLTDEDAFQALGTQGLSVLVRSTYRTTLAHAWIRPPTELSDFLERWRNLET